jgi:hypothetical protein
MTTITLTEKFKGAILEVTVSTENNYFSVTGSYYEKLPQGQKYFDYKEFNGSKFEHTEGGCIHERVLKSFPQLQKVVNLHLSNLEGEPMYMVANGMYHFEKNPQTAKEYLRISDKDFEGVKTTKDLVCLFPKLYDQYKAEAVEAMGIINSLNK